MRYATAEVPRLYRIDALEAEGFSRRQIKGYREFGLLPPPVGRGGGAYYTEVHIACLRRIRQAKDENRTTEDIREMNCPDETEED